MAQADVADRSGRNGHVTETAEEPKRSEGRRSLVARALREVASQAQRRIPKADLDERDPDYIRENLPLAVAAGEPVVPWRGPRPGQHPRVGARCYWSATTPGAT